MGGKKHILTNVKFFFWQRARGSDERDRQRLSFVAGLVGDGSDVTRDKIREVLEKH